MKIDYMVKREDFYKICKTTLESYYKKNGLKLKITTQKRSRKAFAYVYEKLNAIIAKKPGKEVKRYLYTEYKTRGSLIKKIVVKLYMFILLNTNGIFADKVLVTDSLNIDCANILIYPCNKRFRIFDFNKQIVDVITKHGFQNDYLKNEIEFRQKFRDMHIQPILSSSEDWYSEKIINGQPLARISCTAKYNILKEKALNILNSITKHTKHTCNSVQYVNKTINEIMTKANILLGKNELRKNKLSKLLDFILHKLSSFNENITLKLCHGDFQSGNIFIENNSGKIVIIDWETTCIKSEWYDVFTLYGGLRKTDGIKKLLNNLSKKIGVDYIQYENSTQLKYIMLLVLLEDILYRINELECLSIQIGLDEFNHYCSKLYDDLIKIK